MSVYEVPEAQWARFCERFAREHHGESVTLELTDEPDNPDADREIVIAHRPLEALVLAQDRGGQRRVMVAIEGTLGRRSELMVPEPTRLRMEQHGERDGGLLRVDSTAYRTLLLRFDEPLTPGELDRLP